MSAVAAPAGRRGDQRQRTVVRERSLVLMPPEGVPINLVVPSLGARVAAQVVDIVLTVATTIVLVLALVYTDAVAASAVAAVGSLLFLLVGTPFYVLSELLMNGRTPGKRLVGIRVVSLDGGGLTTHQVVVRNLLKEVEIFLPLQVAPAIFVELGPIEVIGWLWGAAVAAVVLRTRARQRIGDIAAGTVVVRQPTAKLLPDLAADPAVPSASAPAQGGFAFGSEQLELYGAYELQVLERVLRGHATGERTGEDAFAEVADSIARKIGYGEAIAEAEREAFLLAFYRAQRAFLEQKKLFGDARDDKFHRDAGGPAPDPKPR